jgi:SAM-dependent methyltransferase
MATQALDETKLQAFMGKVVGDLSGTMVSFLCSIGDRLGLFKELSANGPASSVELAARAGIDERYAREWLRALTTAGYLEYDGLTQRYSLPPEHALALAQEGGPMFVGGMYQMIPAFAGPLNQLIQAFRQGGGVPQAAYDQAFWDGFERFSGGWFENLLIQQWIPAVPSVQTKLERGALVADIGSGRGRALIKLAQAFPRSRFVGFDNYEPTVALAAANAQAAGVADRVSFRALDVVQGLPEQYDLITTFDVVHDMANPRGALKAIRRALKADGTYLCLEINCADNPEENAGPIAALFYGASVLYCMTSSLSAGGEGLGTMGLPQAKIRELCVEAGFGPVRRLPLENPFNTLYEIKA